MVATAATEPTSGAVHVGLTAVGVPIAPAGQARAVVAIAATLSLIASDLEQVGSSAVGVPVVPVWQV